MVIKRVGVVSMGKLMGLLYAGIGLILGACFALFSLLGGGALLAAGGEEGAMGGGMMMGMGVAAILFFPIMYGIIGFIGGLLTAWLYNVAAKFAGGIEIDVQ